MVFQIIASALCCMQTCTGAMESCRLWLAGAPPSGYLPCNPPLAMGEGVASSELLMRDTWPWSRVYQRECRTDDSLMSVTSTHNRAMLRYAATFVILAIYITAAVCDVPTPTKPQLVYQNHEIMALIHFNMATYAGGETDGYIVMISL